MKNSSQMGIPEDWELTTLGQITKFASGGTPSKEKAEYWGGEIPWITAKDLKSFYLYTSIDKLTILGSKNGTRNALPGSILALVRGMTLLKDFPIGYVAKEMSYNQDIKNIIPNNSVDGLFLAFALQGLKSQVMDIVSVAGHGTGKLETDQLKALPILLPPLPEQHHIASILSQWDDSLSILSRLIDAKRQQKRGLAEQLLTGKRRLPGFGGKWSIKSLSNYLKESRVPGSDGSKAKKLTVKLWGKGVYEKKEKILGSKSTKYFSRSAGQLIFSKLDFLNGAFGIIPSELDGFESTLDLPSFDFLADVEPTFVLELISRESFYSIFESGAIGGRKARRVTPEEFLKAEMPFPPFPEQKAIATVLSTLDLEVASLEALKAKVAEQKRGLMDALLTGRVRVKVEDAS